MADTRGRVAYRFGPFQLDARERRLSRGSEVIPLRLKVFDTLRVLVENAGRLVTKQELLDAVWPETTVEENNLNHNVSVLRKALGEKGDRPAVHRDCPAGGLSLCGAGRIRGGARRSLCASAAKARQEIRTARRAKAFASPMPASAADRPGQGVELADPSRFRMGQPDLAALVGGALRFTTASSVTTSVAMACRSATFPM